MTSWAELGLCSGRDSWTAKTIWPSFDGYFFWNLLNFLVCSFQKILGQKKGLVREILGGNFFGVQQFLSPKVWFRKNFEFKKSYCKKILGPKVIWVHENLGPKKDVIPLKSGVKKNLDRKILGYKNFWLGKFLGPKKFLLQKIVGYKKVGS